MKTHYRKYSTKWVTAGSYDKDTETHEVNKDAAHHGAQFISMHLNILFIVLCSCNLVVPQSQADALACFQRTAVPESSLTLAKCEPATSAAMLLPIPIQFSLQFFSV